MNDQQTILMRMTKPTVSQLEKIIGGPIDIAYLDNDTQLIYSADNELSGFPKNKRATRLVKKVHPTWKIYGNAVIVEGAAS